MVAGTHDDSAFDIQVDAPFAGWCGAQIHCSDEALCVPMAKDNSPTRFLPLSGYVAGLYERTDSQGGVFKAPAGTEANLLGPLDFAARIGDAEPDLEYRRQIMKLSPRYIVTGLFVFD